MLDEASSVFVTKPSLPDLIEFIPYLEKIWKDKWLTNNGEFHKKFENELANFLGVKYLSLFCNGTIALLVALKALDIKGEVITTPFSFVATAHSLLWNNLTPVFVDIEKYSYNLDPDRIVEAITDKTTAIMPVHVYGIPCDVKKIEEIAKKYNLKVIYDAAHAFGVKIKGESVLNYGDLSVLSFHATKVFTTFEGGAIISHDEKTKDKIDKLKNFGFAGETSVIDIGINGKMNEFQSAFGLLYLRNISNYIGKRRIIAEKYNELLSNVDGITLIHIPEDVEYNYSYYPILVEEKKYGKSRDELYEYLKSKNIFCRRYFYPLITDFSMYVGNSNCPNAEEVAWKVLCLPIFPDLELKNVELIANYIIEFNK